MHGIRLLRRETEIAVKSTLQTDARNPTLQGDAANTTVEADVYIFRVQGLQGL